MKPDTWTDGSVHHAVIGDFKAWSLNSPADALRALRRALLNRQREDLAAFVPEA